MMLNKVPGLFGVFYAVFTDAMAELCPGMLNQIRFQLIPVVGVVPDFLQ